jgi:phage-related protein
MGRNSTIQISILADTRRASAALARFGSEVAGLGKILALPTVAPALAAVTAGVLEFSTALTVATAAGAVFALSIGGIFKDMLDARKQIQATELALSKLPKGTEEYRETLQKLHQQQKAFNDEFGPAAKGYDRMTDAFSRFKQKTSGVTDKVLSKAFSGLAALLPRLVPVSNAAGRAIGGLLDDLRHFTAGTGFQEFLNTIKTSGSADLTRFGHIIGNTIGGLASVLKHFVGPGDRFTASLERATNSFRAWAKSPGANKSIDSFLDYVHKNGPSIAASFGSLAAILPKLAHAFADLGGGGEFKAISLFLNLIAHLPQGMFDVVVTGALAIAAMVKVIKIWTAAQAALNIVMDANPVLLIITAIVALGVAFVVAYKHSAKFRSIVQGVLGAVKSAVSGFARFFTKTIPAAVSSVINFVKSHWKVIASILGGPLVAAVLLIKGHIGQIKSAISGLVGWIKGLAGGFLSAGKTLGSNIIDGIKHGLSAVAGVAGSIASGVRDALVGVINSLIDRLNDAIPNSLGKGVLSINLPDNPIPRLASGGIVTRATVALVGESGPEAVIPLKYLKRGGNTYNLNVTAPVGTDPYTVGETIVTAIRAYEAGGGVA